MKRRIIRVLIIFIGIGACIFNSIKDDDTRYTEDICDSTEQNEAEFQEIKVIDNIKEIKKNTIEENDSESSRVNIITDDSYLPIENTIYNEESLDDIRLNNIRFAVPSDCARGFGSPVFSTNLMSELELETICNWNAMYTAVGDDCPECNDGIEAARKWIAEGNLQKPIEKFLESYPEIFPEKREYVLYVTSAEESYREEDETSWWEVSYYLVTQIDESENILLAFGDIYRTTAYDGQSLDYNDAHYSIHSQNENIWKLLEEPDEDVGEVWLDFIEENSIEDDFSVFYSLPEESKEEWLASYLSRYGSKMFLPSDAEQQINWKFYQEEDFWYDYMVCIGETSEYEVRMEIPLMPTGSGNWYMASRIRKEAQDKKLCSDTLSVMRQTFHAVPYEYVVREGNTLSGIAEKYLGDETEYPRLMSENGITNPGLIYSGEKIIISP